MRSSIHKFQSRICLTTSIFTLLIYLHVITTRRLVTQKFTSLQTSRWRHSTNLFNGAHGKRGEHFYAVSKTGLNKDGKEWVAKVESKISVIARQGRAFGVHLILATQRPDATILSGQIRSNIDCRVCGRADNVLSQIILDSTAASELIPKDAQGRFLLHNCTIFQSYMFDDSNLKG